MGSGPISWAGVAFHRVGHHDGRFFREPGLFAFARSDPGEGAVLLYAGQADDLARGAGPAHPAWAECLGLGLNELHICRPLPVRVDRLQLLARVIQRAGPLLNVLAEAHPAPALQTRLDDRSAA